MKNLSKLSEKELLDLKKKIDEELENRKMMSSVVSWSEGLSGKKKKKTTSPNMEHFFG